MDSYTTRTFQRERICIVCRNTYKLCTSIGQWECKYHPGSEYYDYKTQSTKIYCCETPDSIGCKRCDHYSGVSEYNYDPEDKYDDNYKKVYVTLFTDTVKIPDKKRIKEGKTNYNPDKTIDKVTSYVLVQIRE